MSRRINFSAMLLPSVVLASLGLSPFTLMGDDSSKPRTAKSKSVFDLKSRTPAEMKILVALDDKTELEFVDTPLSDAIEFLSELHNISIVLDNEAMREAGVSPDEPLNNVLSGVSLRSALKIMLSKYGLTYIIKNEVLQVTSTKVANKTMETQVYDVRALATAGLDSEQLAEVIQVTIAPETWFQAATSLRFSSDGKSVSLMSGEHAIEIWTIEGGKPRKQILKSPLGTAGIRAIPNGLDIRQSLSMHREIVDLLKQLELFSKLKGGATKPRIPR